MSTQPSALEGAGFTLADERTVDAGGKIGRFNIRYYTAKKNDVGLRPMVHHVHVVDFERNPGKHNVSYRVTQNGHPLEDFDFDMNHNSNGPNGSDDPVGDMLGHHKSVVDYMDNTPDSSSLIPVKRDDIYSLLPGRFNWVQSDGAHYLMPWRGEEPMTTMSSLGPLDINVARKLKAEGFHWGGRSPDDSEETDIYHKSYPWPDSPNTFNANFIVLHTPSRVDPFSYGAKRVQSGINDDGSEDEGSFIDVTGYSDKVAQFGTVKQVMDRHKAVKEAIGIPSQSSRQRNASGPVSEDDWTSFVAGRNPVHGMMPDGTPVVDHFDPNHGHDEPNPRGGSHRVYEPHAARGPHGEVEVYVPHGNCVTCGRPTWNTRDGGEVPDWENTGNAHYANEYEMHGPDIPQCAECANEYDSYKEALRAGQRPGGLWHHPGARPNSCDECSRSILENADEDLEP